jgi:uncharacterized protein (DUF2461 family)
MRSQYEKDKVIQILNKGIENAQEDETVQALQAQLWVIRMNVVDEDTIFDRDLHPESEAAAFRAVDWLLGRIEEEALIVI